MTTVGDGGARPCRISQWTGAVPERPGVIPLNIIPDFSTMADLLHASSSFLLPDLPLFSLPPQPPFLYPLPKYSICSLPTFFQTSHLLLPMLLLLLVLLLPFFLPSFPPSQTSKQDLIGRRSGGGGGGGAGGRPDLDRQEVSVIAAGHI